MLSGFFGIVLNIILSVSKFITGSLTNSVAITADAFNNLTDCLTSLLTILGFHWSAKPADKEHPFGHSRIEYLVSLVVAGVILITGYEVMRSSINKILSPEPMIFTPFAVGVLLFSILVKLWMFIFNRKLGRTINSNALIAVGIDSRNDVIITSATLVSLVSTLFLDFIIDGYVGALIALILLRSGYQVAKEALSNIIGNPTERDMAADIKQIVKGYDGILGVHDLVVHSYGPGRDMASLHAEVSIDVPFMVSHDIIEQASSEVHEKLGVTLVIHLDPIDTTDERLQGMIELTRGILEREHSTLIAHEFRIINSKPRPRFVFDLEIPHTNKNEALKLRDSIIHNIKNAAPEYDYEINIEHGYVE